MTAMIYSEILLHPIAHLLVTALCHKQQLFGGIRPNVNTQVLRLRLCPLKNRRKEKLINILIYQINVFFNSFRYFFILEPPNQI